MELYYSKNKIFIKLSLSLISLLVVGWLILTVFDLTTKNLYSDEGGWFAGALILLSPCLVVAAVYLIKFTILFLSADNLLIRIDEQGITLNLNKKYRKAGLMTWNSIASIESSTDNMNKPAIRISLRGHIQGMYQFYITTPNAKNTGVPLPQILDTIMSYYTANK